jgi:hypothetical protein
MRDFSKIASGTNMDFSVHLSDFHFGNETDVASEEIEAMCPHDIIRRRAR